MKPAQKAIIRTLLYFDIFDHPLTKKELFELNSTSTPQEEFDHDLEELLKVQIIGWDSGYYFLGNGQSNIQERLDKLDRSVKHQKIAHFVSGLISRYPFVRAVMLSGSLSKKSQSRKDDIDFFIIAEPGRLWLCKTILMLFKKIFLLNSKKYFCVNYFIDSVNLEIPEKNIFTATELAFLQPMNNSGLYNQFIDANAWIKSYFPNWIVQTNGCEENVGTFIKRSVEKVFIGKFGDKIDTIFMDIYKRRSQRKFGKSHKNMFSLNFKSEKHVSKHHPNGFQPKIIQHFESKISEFEMKHNVNLTI